MRVRLIVAVLVSMVAVALRGQQYTWTTFAGPDGGAGYVDGVGMAARFAQPSGITVDKNGNVYVADTVNDTIRKITPLGSVTTLAGRPAATDIRFGNGGPDGLNMDARFLGPHGLTVDAAGNVYLADTWSNTVRIIAAAGAVTTAAGAFAQQGYVDATGPSARFDSPTGIARDAAGNLYVSERYKQTIRRITPAGVVSTFAGSSGMTGSTNGSGSIARFNQPAAIAIDTAGNLFVADNQNGTIRKITPLGDVSTYAGVAGDRNVVDGSLAVARFSSPNGIAVDAAGNVFVTDGDTIRKIVAGGGVTTLVPSSAGLGVELTLALAPDGSLFVADSMKHVVYKVSAAGAVASFAGRAAVTGALNGASASATFNGAQGLAIDSSDNIYLADRWNCLIRRITPAGSVSTFAGTAGACGSGEGAALSSMFNAPTAVALDGGGNVYVADTGNNTIRKISGGVVSTVAGAAGQVGMQNGAALSSRFNAPAGIAVDGLGNVIIADTGNNTIRKLSGGNVSPVAGVAGVTGSADGTGTGATFYGPAGLSIGPDGNTYVADENNHTIRKVTPSGQTTTFAGTPGVFWFVYPNPNFYNPAAISVRPDGTMYVAEFGGDRIDFFDGAKWSPIGGGTGRGSMSGTGGTALFYGPSGIAVDSKGQIFASEWSKIRVGRPALQGSATSDAAIPPQGFTLPGYYWDGNTPFGVIGATRKLSSSSPATSWNWSISVRPSGSVANLSAANIAAPTFVPDVLGHYEFMLDASDATKRSITTTQFDARPCWYLIVPPTSVTAAASGGNGSFGVSYETSSFCSSTEATSAAWLTLGGSSLASAYGATTKTISYSVAPTDVCVARIAAITTTGGSALTLTQDPAVTLVEVTQSNGTIVSPTVVQNVSFNGDTSGKVVVETGGQCSWTAASSYDWIHITSSVPRVGIGDLTFSVDPTSNSARTGTIIVAGQAISISQAGVGTGKIFQMINSLFGGADPPTSSDCNGDAAFNVADVFCLINYVFAGGPEPAP